jgi:probable H4MPT-linked C1 transfer pathway protein
MAVVGWDIGGVNTKVACVIDGAVLAARTQPFEIQRDPSALAPLLSSLASLVGATPDDRHAVTMTAELSQMFRTKREGVAFVLDAICAACPDADIAVYAVDGRFLKPDDAYSQPLAVAASNWAATARLIAADHPDAILIDIGTTTTDIIPIVAGAIATLGSTDPARLASRELVYSGALRTPVEAIVRHVPLGSGDATVSAESFALIGDVHVWRGQLSPDDYSVGTPDGRPPTPEFAGERIARIVCADRDILDAQAISRIADAVADAQCSQIADAISRVRDRHPSLTTAIVAGLGAFIAERAADTAGLDVGSLADSIGFDASRAAPAAAVALLLDRDTDAQPRPPGTRQRLPNASRAVARLVVKIGGGLLAHAEVLDTVIAQVVGAARSTRVVIVPGGGPFADTVRAADKGNWLGDDTAHWMAVLATDQYAHLLAARSPALTLAESMRDVESALASGKVPVIAPYRWLREADPLPHSWDVTSDSIAAWFTSTLGATRLVLVKPAGAMGDDLVDPHFKSAVPASISWAAVPADRLSL